MGHDERERSPQTVDVGARPSLFERLIRAVQPEPPPRREWPIPLPAPPADPSPPLSLPPSPPATKLDLVALRDTVDRLDARLAHELVERDGKLAGEMRRGMLGLETELSERFSAAVLENRRALRRAFTGIALLVACIGALLVVLLLRA